MAGDLDLAAIADRVAKATPGPWRWTGKYDPSTECYDDGDLSNPEIAKSWHKTDWRNESTWHGGAVLRGFGAHSDYDYLAVSPADAEFIAHAREDMPALLARVQSLETAIRLALELLENRPSSFVPFPVDEIIGDLRNALDGDRG